jgi:hypothetical protein
MGTTSPAKFTLWRIAQRLFEFFSSIDGAGGVR